MALRSARPVSVRAAQRYPLLQEELYAEARVNGGMITTVDPADIPESALALAVNARTRFDKTSRRFGYSAMSPADGGDSATALDLATWKLNSGSIYLVKLRPTGPRYTDFNAWFAPTGTALTGGVADRFSWTVAQDRFIFANNGVDFVQQLLIGSPGTFARLGNAPKAKYVTGFYNRIVVANYTDPAAGTPVTIGWSGDLNPTVFDTATDVSAGSGPLVESPADAVDYITRVIGFTNVMVILRERSVWLATKQPIGSTPFNFFGAVAGIGCNCPHSVAVIPNGLVWVDLITGTVWAYTLGGQPERIGLPIEKLLVAGVSDQNQVWGTYNGQFNEFTATVVQAGTNVRRMWTYNFTAKAWGYDELPDIYSTYDSQESFDVGLTVGDLVGRVVDLVPTVANLVATKHVSITRLIGKVDGTIYQEDTSADVDTSGPYTTELQSKDFVFPDVDTYVSQFRLEYVPHKVGSIELSYSKNMGNTWTVIKTVPVPASFVELPQLLRAKKSIKARRFRWRVRASSGLWDILSYEIRVFQGAESRK